MQGLTFGADTWLLHLARPPTGDMTRATLYVLLSRFRNMDSVKLLTSLWAPGDDIEKQSVIAFFLGIARGISSDLLAEAERLRGRAAATQTALAHLYDKYGEAVKCRQKRQL